MCRYDAALPCFHGRDNTHLSEKPPLGEPLAGQMAVQALMNQPYHGSAEQIIDNDLDTV